MKDISLYIKQVLFLFSLFFSPLASSHPHSWIDLKTDIVIKENQITGLNMQWTFDDMTSMYLLDGEDMSDSQRDTSLQMLADGMADNMTRVSYMTYLIDEGGHRASFKRAENTRLQQTGLQLTYYFYLPLKEPISMNSPIALSIYDESHYTDMTWLAHHDVQLSGHISPKCKVKVHDANPTDEQTKYAFSLDTSAQVDTNLGALFTQHAVIDCSEKDK